MTCPQCGCVFCVDDDLPVGHDCRKKYCSSTCKKRAANARAGRRPWGMRPATARRVKPLLWQRQEGLCALCGKPMIYTETTVDHKQPRSHGGSDSIENLQLAHEECNANRADDCPGCPECLTSLASSSV